MGEPGMVKNKDEKGGPMLNKKIQDALNDQINHEFYSAYYYLAASAYCEEKFLSGFAKWLKEQAQEEITHAMKLFDLIHERAGRVELAQIDRPPSRFQSILDVFQQVLKHEQEVTGMIHALYELAQKEKDYATQIALQWFVTEQVEEEKTSAELVERLKIIGDEGSLLMMMDKELGTRTNS